MTQGNERVDRIVAEAEAMIAEAQKMVEEGEAYFRKNNIDPEADDSALGPKEKEMLARLTAEDQARIERAVEEEKARLSFSSSGQGSRPAKHRSMI